MKFIDDTMDAVKVEPKEGMFDAVYQYGGEIVKAVRWTGHNETEVRKLAASRAVLIDLTSEMLVIPTAGFNHIAAVGDYLIAADYGYGTDSVSVVTKESFEEHYREVIPRKVRYEI